MISVSTNLEDNYLLHIQLRVRIDFVHLIYFPLLKSFQTSKALNYLAGQEFSDIVSYLFVQLESFFSAIICNLPTIISKKLLLCGYYYCTNTFSYLCYTCILIIRLRFYVVYSCICKNISFSIQQAEIWDECGPSHPRLYLRRYDKHKNARFWPTHPFKKKKETCTSRSTEFFVVGETNDGPS